MDIDWNRIDNRRYRDSMGLLSQTGVYRRIGGNSKTLAEKIIKKEVPPPDFECVGFRKMKLWWSHKIKKPEKTRRKDLIWNEIGYVPVIMDSYQERFSRDVWGFIRLMESQKQ